MNPIWILIGAAAFWIKDQILVSPPAQASQSPQTPSAQTPTQTTQSSTAFDPSTNLLNLSQATISNNLLQNALANIDAVIQSSRQEVSVWIAPTTSQSVKDGSGNTTPLFFCPFTGSYTMDAAACEVLTASKYKPVITNGMYSYLLGLMYCPPPSPEAVITLSYFSGMQIQVSSLTPGPTAATPTACGSIGYVSGPLACSVVNDCLAYVDSKYAGTLGPEELSNAKAIVALFAANAIDQQYTGKVAFQDMNGMPTTIPGSGASIPENVANYYSSLI